MYEAERTLSNFCIQLSLKYLEMGREMACLTPTQKLSFIQESLIILVALPNSINPSTTRWETGGACDLIKINWLHAI